MHMKAPCLRCPFRRDVKPFLTPARGEELAFHAGNPYNSFPCHKTTGYDDELDKSVVTEKTMGCAGFLTLQINEGAYTPDGFESSNLVYDDIWEMVDAYANQKK